MRFPHDHWLKLALALAIVASCWLLTFRDGLSNVDEVYLFGVTRSLVERGSFAIDELRWVQERVKGGKIGPDGELYTKYGPGVSLVTAPGYWLGRAFSPPGLVGEFAGVIMAPLGAIRGVLAIGLLISLSTVFGAGALVRALGGSWTSAGWVALALGLGTILWPYALFNLSEPLTAAALVWGVTAASVAVRRGSGSLALLAGAALGVALLARPVSAVLVPIVLGYLVLRWPTPVRPLPAARLAPLIAAALPLTAAAFALAWYNLLRFGSPLDFGYEDESFTTPILVGIAGLLLSPGKSLLLFNPGLLLALAGGWRLLHRWRAETSLLLGLSGVSLVLHAAWWSWEGGWSWGPRLLLPIVPLLAALALPTVERASPWALTLALPLSALLPLLGALANPLAALEETIAGRGVPERGYPWSVTPWYVAVQWERLRAHGSEALLLRGLPGELAFALPLAVVGVGAGLYAAVAAGSLPTTRRWLPVTVGGTTLALLLLSSLAVLAPPRSPTDPLAPPLAQVREVIELRSPANAGVVFASWSQYYRASPFLKDHPAHVIGDDWDHDPSARERLAAFASHTGEVWLIDDRSESDPARLAFSESILRQTGLLVSEIWVDQLRLLQFTHADLLANTPMVAQVARFGDVVTLTAHSPIASPIALPGTLRIITRWSASAPAGRQLKYFVHLADGADRPVRQVDRPLALPASTVEPVSRDLIEVTDLVLDAAVPPGEYRLLLGVYEAPAGPRLSLELGAANHLEIGRIRVMPRPA